MKRLAALVALAGCAAAPGAPQSDLPIAVLKPDGAGPFPAVVMMHDCSGLGPRSSGAPRRWADELVARGYVVVMPDSFSRRGVADGVCTTAASRRAEVTPVHRANDAHRALAHARTLPYVDGKKVGLMGGSHGGASTLFAMLQPGFAGAIALYPRCSGPFPHGPYGPAAPVRILIGEKDDWTPAALCERLVQEARNAGKAVSIKVYPGAHHSFDSDRPVLYRINRINPSAPGGRGATTGGDPAAWADARLEVARFFAEHLK